MLKTVITERDYFSLSPRLNKINLNSMVYFNCNLDRVEWYYNREPIAFSNLHTTNSGTTLIITRSQMQNGGWYYCYGLDLVSREPKLASGIYIPIGIIT